MRKMIVILFAALLLLSACGSSPAATGTVPPADTAGSTEAAPATQKPLGLAYLSESEQAAAKQVGEDPVNASGIVSPEWRSRKACWIRKYREKAADI